MDLTAPDVHAALPILTNAMLIRPLVQEIVEACRSKRRRRCRNCWKTKVTAVGVFSPPLWRSAQHGRRPARPRTPGPETCLTCRNALVPGSDRARFPQLRQNRKNMPIFPMTCWSSSPMSPDSPHPWVARPRRPKAHSCCQPRTPCSTRPALY